MENQTNDKDENLFERDNSNDFSSGPLAAASDDTDDTDDDMSEDEMDEDDDASSEAGREED